LRTPRAPRATRTSRERDSPSDQERDTFEHAESVNRMVLEWYRRCGYQVLEVPRVSVDERCTFVLQALPDSDA
jgi:predicted ATPase